MHLNAKLSRSQVLYSIFDLGDGLEKVPGSSKLAQKLENMIKTLIRRCKRKVF